MINLIGELVEDWRRLDERIASVSTEIEASQAGRELPTAHERSGHRSDRLQRSRGGDWQRQWLQAGARPHTLSSSDGQGRQDKVCGRGSRRHRSGFPATCWQLRSPTSSLASPGQFSTKGARSNARRPMRWHPKLLNPRAVLTPIKAWPGNLEQAASQVRRPALTATARGASQLATSIATVMQTRSRKVATHASNCTLGQPTFGIG